MKSNIILVGMPGSGKTSIGSRLADKLSMDLLDFDDDIIEVEMGKTVGEVLAQLGEEKFLELEKDLALNLNIKNTILSTSGSVPLKKEAMDYLRKDGISILINIPLDTIKNRLVRMKVDRIVGMNNMTMEEILKYRQGFYEKAFDYKFDTTGLATKDEVFEEFMNWYNNGEVYKKISMPHII